MSRLSKLLQVTQEEKRAILKHYDMTEEKFEESVDMLSEWVNKSEHLPNEENKNKFRLALLNAKMSVEKAKQSMNGYYRIRVAYSSEFFNKLVPNTKEYQEGKKFVTTVVMPKLTPNLCRVTIFKMSDPNGEASDAYLYNILLFMMAELRIATDFCLSNIIIFDYEKYAWKNLIKFTPAINQKLIDMFMAVHLRVHSIHFVNQTNLVDQIMRMAKALLPSKIVDKVHSHNSFDSLRSHIPPECLPSDYGGDQKSMDELYEEWCEQIEQSEELFQKLVDTKVPPKRIELDSSQGALFGCGVDGSFRKLCLD